MKNLLIITVFLLMMLSVPLLGNVNQNNDFQLWLYHSVNKKLTERSRLYIDGEIRYGDNASTLYLYYVQARLLYTVDKHLDIFPSYRQLWVSGSASRKWIPIYEPFIDFTLKFDIKKWQISDRHRPSRRFFDGGPSLWQYRNRLTITLPWKLGKMQLNPLFFDEVFFRETVGFFENRFGTGVSFPITKRYKGYAYYMLRHIEIADVWRKNHVLWLQLDFSF